MILASAHVRIKRFVCFFLIRLVWPCDNKGFKQRQRQRKRQNLKQLFDCLNEENNRAARATRTLGNVKFSSKSF